MSNTCVENIHVTKNYALLEEVYKDILIPCFPDPEDHLSWRKMKYMAKNGIENPDENGRVLISVSKERQDNGTEIPISFVVGVYYKRSQTGLISYMGMRGGCKGKTAADVQARMKEALFDEAHTHGKKLKSVFSIVDLPEKANPKYITLPPVKRIVMMERMGASHIPINFHYPMFDTGIFSLFRAKVSYKNDAALLGYKLDGKISTQDPTAIKDFLDDLYASYGLNALKDKVAQKMKDEVDAIEVGQNVKLSKIYRKKHPKEQAHMPVNNLPGSHKLEPALHRKMLGK